MRLTTLVRWGIFPALCFAFVAGGARVARADIIFETGNHPQPDEQNIMLTMRTTGATERFRDRLEGKPADESPVAQDNEGLRSKICQGLVGILGQKVQND